MPDPYDARAAVPEIDAILADLAARSHAASRQMRLQHGVGPASCPVDLYLPQGPAQGLVVFLHGGYWRAGAAETSGFLAPALAETGLATAVPDYPLAPRAHLSRIVEAVRAAVLWAAQNASALCAEGARVALVGHSAGAHLAAMAIAADYWADRQTPALLGVSGIYDVVPVNRGIAGEWLQLSDDEAAALSPVHHPPSPDSAVHLTVGALESGAFHAQADQYRAVLLAAGVPVTTDVSRSKNHFDVIHRLLDQSDPLHRWLVSHASPAHPKE